MMRFFTSASTILPKAAPMMTPTARSITLPLKAKALNSSNSENAFFVGASDATFLSGSMGWLLEERGPTTRDLMAVAPQVLARFYITVRDLATQARRASEALAGAPGLYRRFRHGDLACAGEAPA